MLEGGEKMQKILNNLSETVDYQQEKIYYNTCKASERSLARHLI